MVRKTLTFGLEFFEFAYNANARGFEIDMNSLIHDLMDSEV